MKPVSLITKSKGYKGFLTSEILFLSALVTLADLDGKILENSQEIALIFTLSTSLLGIFILIHGFIRDYFGYGFARLEIYFFLTLSYALLGISTPGSSDALQYFWIIQFGCIIAGSLNGKQFFTLFPNQFGFLIGNDFK